MSDRLPAPRLRLQAPLVIGRPVWSWIVADPTRRRLLDQLHRENGQTLSALCEQMDMTRQAVTQHLQLLEEANLVAIVWQGREKFHYLNAVPLHEIYERWIAKFERSRLGALHNLKKTLEGNDDEET